MLPLERKTKIKDENERHNFFVLGSVSDFYFDFVSDS